MGKVLVIAEKPDAGRNMAKVLKCDNCKDGYIENEKYIVTWAVGHLIGLKMPEEHNPALKEWKISTLPLIFDIDDSLKVLPDTKKQFEIVKKLIHRPDVDYLINAGDAGREGYLIQSWIYRYAGNRKPVKILWANSLTDEALRHAFANLKEEDIYFKNLLQEAEARAEADYLLGMNYSRVLTLTKSRDITLSYGRCQTPLLYACATPECFKVGKHIKGKTIIPSMVKDLLQNGQTGWIKGFQGKKGAYTAKILFKNGKIEFEFPEQRHR